MARRKYVKENNLVKAINTDSLELQKPLVNEYYDINVHNSNMDKIDKGYKQNKNDISNINYELSKTENTSYTTENGVKEFECKNGYVDNVVIEGETLVNISCIASKNVGEDAIRTRFDNTGDNYNPRYSDGTFTLINYTDKVISFPTMKNSNVSWSTQYDIQPNSKIAVQIPNDASLVGVDFWGINGWTVSSDTIINDSFFAVLEGDHTDKHISYFEGLKSVGQGDKIEVLSYSKNLDERLDLSNLTWKDGYYVHIGTGAEIVSESHCYTTNYIPIQKTGCNMVFINANPHIVFYDENKNVIYQELGYYPSDDLVIVDVPINAKFLRFTGQKSKKNSVSAYYSQYDKKQILTTLRSLPNGVKDTIEKRGNKYVKVQRCGEVVLDGDFIEGKYTAGETANTLRVYTPLAIGLNVKTNSVECNHFISDKFKSELNLSQETTDVDSLSIKVGGEGRFVFRISKSKLPTQDLDGAKTWLKSNPVTVVYELATPIIEELPNFNPQTFSDKTTLLLNSGVVQGECNFEVTNSLGSELEVLKNKASDLDDYAVDEEVYYPTLLNGWTDRYSSNSLKISKIGNIVIMEGNLYSGTVTVGTLVFTIPEKFRPKRNMFTTVCSRTKSLLGTFIIGLDGNVVVQDNGFGDASSSSGGIAFSYTYSLI